MTLKKPQFIDFVEKNRTIEQAEEIFQQRLDDAQDIYSKFSNQFTIRPCPICGHETFKKLEPFHSSYGVVQCSKCMSAYVNPCPSLEALSHYYNFSKCNAQLGEIFRSRVKKGNIIMSSRTSCVLELIENLIAQNDTVRVLEVGCSSGSFLSELNEALEHKDIANQVTLEGIDLDAAAVKRCVDSKITLHAQSAEDFSSQNEKAFDLVLHFELLEHLADPLSFMKAVFTMLNDGGYCHFHTPNANGFDNQALSYNDFRPLAHGIFPPMHLQAFTPQNILHFVLRAGFQLHQLDTPGNFDVDIVKRFHNRKPVSEFSLIEKFSDDQLAIVQLWFQRVYASSHMRCTVRK